MTIAASLTLCMAALAGSGRSWAAEDFTRANASADQPDQPIDIDIPILAYHKIDASTPSEWFVSAEQFARQMDVLLAYGYTTISLQDFVNYHNGIGTPPAKPIIITFDDGFQGVYTYARPILLSRNMDAAFFIITGMIGETEAERKDNSSWNGNDALVYHLIWPEISQMYSEGFDFESHTVTHPTLTGLPIITASQEITQSRLALQAHLNTNAANFFAYPHGAYNATVRDLVQQAGYQAAVRYGPNDGIANPATPNLDLWALPRRAIKRDVTLVLDPNNPWWFFMQRVDPDFPIPNLSIKDFKIVDAAGAKRTHLYAGEQVTMTVQATNWMTPTYVTGSLELDDSNGLVYDSHQAVPVQDDTANPLPYGNPGAPFDYPWTTPAVQGTEAYTYTFKGFDEYYLLKYYDSGPRAGFTVEPSPISVEVAPQTLELTTTAQTEITFTVNYTGTGALRMYLSASLSSGLEINSASADDPDTQITRYSIGSLVKARGCSTPCMHTSNLLYEFTEAVYGGGAKTYHLTMVSLPGAAPQQWVKFRLSMDVPAQLTTDYYLHDPLGGETDQQNYFAYVLPVSLQQNYFYLPLVSR